jgi:hypothetical protein
MKQVFSKGVRYLLLIAVFGSTIAGCSKGPEDTPNVPPANSSPDKETAAPDGEKPEAVQHKGN